MSRPAIEVSGLSKRYVIEHESRHDTLRDTLHHAARKLWRRWRWGTSFAREEFWALRDVSFTVQPGEVVGIIGRNGAGKSTLLKIVSRITEATEGKVTLRGRVASLLEVGTGFHPDLTGRENIFLNGAILGMSRVEIRQKFDEIVAFAEVERFLDTPVKRYSSGMYVRLAFAVAALLEPEVLIVDEVLSVGDAAFQKKCLGKMQQVVRDTGRTVLFVSHNLPAVQSICSSGIVLEAGRTTGLETIDLSVARYLRSLQAPGVDPGAVRRSQPVSLASIQAEDAAGRPTGELAVCQPAVLRITIVAQQRLADLRATLGFTDAQAQRVFGLASFHRGFSLSLEPGTHQFEVRFTPPPLFPGTFQLDFGLYTARGDAVLETYGAGYIVFTDPPELTLPVGPRSGFGLIRVDSNWNAATPEPRT